MKKSLLILVTMLLLSPLANVTAQIKFDPSIPTEWVGQSVTLPKSPLTMQVLFIGGHHLVQTLDKNGMPNGTAVAKQWHDFIGLTKDNSGSGDIGWLSINHEMVWNDDKIGDGGGMTVFKIRRDPTNDTLIIVPQTLPDGRSGLFFNVDFANTVGETGMNCGGIISEADGRIWTAEEWFRVANDADNASVGSNTIYWGANQPFTNGGRGQGVRDTADWTINSTINGSFNGRTIKKFENFNWFVEIDPRTAKAVRKQYNWGRGGWEGGVIMPDNRTMYGFEDMSPGIFTKFVADVAGDFTKGTLYAYKKDAPGGWIVIPNNNIDSTLQARNIAMRNGASMFNRLEWGAYCKKDGKVYFTETGRDAWGSSFNSGVARTGTIPDHFVGAVKLQNPSWLTPTMTDAQILDSVRVGRFNDYYGRVLCYDPATNKVTSFLEGGPYYSTSPAAANYPNNHLASADGLGFMTVGTKTYMIIQEDLIGRSFGRVPEGVTNNTCEMYLLDMDDEPTVENLKRISVVPDGAEITGAVATPDGKSIIVNSQHPSADLPFPWRNSLTYAITGFDKAVTSIFNEPTLPYEGFEVWPNPVNRELKMNKTTDVAVYDASGNRIKVVRNSNVINMFGLSTGTYFIRTAEGETKKVIVE